MEQKTSTLNYSLKWGVIIGVILIIYTLLLYILDLSMNKALGWLSFVILIVGVFMAIKNYRDKLNNGLLSFGNGFSIGLLIFIFSGIISAIFSYVLFTYIAPELIDKITAAAEENLLNKGIPEDMIETQMAMAKKFMSPTFMVLTSLISSVVIGAIISLIIAAILKKENKTPFTQTV